MNDNVVALADYREPEGETVILDDEPMDPMESATFSQDVVADQWANRLVHELVARFAEQADGLNSEDPVYRKLMEAMADVVRSMTRHHLGVYDTIALTLAGYPDAEVLVIVQTLDGETFDGG